MADFHAAYPEYARDGAARRAARDGVRLPGRGRARLPRLHRRRAAGRGRSCGRTPRGSAAGASATRTRRTRRRARPRGWSRRRGRRCCGFFNATRGRLRGDLHAERHRRLPPGRRGVPVRRRGGRLVLTADNHNSVNGIREYAPGARRPGRLRAADGARAAGQRRATCSPRSAARPRAGAAGCSPTRRSPTSPACSIRSTGCSRAQEAGYDVLLDAAAFVPTNRLDLSAVRPEFVAMSWYKMFGYPTGVGCLLARRDALSPAAPPVVLRRHDLGRERAGRLAPDARRRGARSRTAR